ncbi:unnamed protein product [Nippostrongylus brasiliensis]|uniref:PMEI domain-containing protein n=1 Tax=Nippostrongylus brasiliensis TaxID=27835 RepID=A0A0N4Y011_NIPBR|nr:unnamed protein product [Nippostrongylus brasiliensis]
MNCFKEAATAASNTHMCAKEDANLCRNVQLAYDGNAGALFLIEELISNASLAWKMLRQALECLKKILEGDKDHKSNLMNALRYQLEALDGVTSQCQDGAKCKALSDFLAWSMDVILTAMKVALPDKKDDIQDKYDLVFGKNGASSGKYAEDMYYAGREILDMLQEEQSESV